MPHRLIPRRFRDRVGRRGLVLLLFGLAWIVQGIATGIFPDVPPSGVWHEDIPNIVLAAMWVISGLVSIIYAFIKKHRNDTIGFLAASGMPMLLACSYGISTFTLVTIGSAHWFVGPFGLFIWLAVAVALSVVASWPEEGDSTKKEEDNRD